MGLFNQSRSTQEQLVSGKISYALALKLTRLAYLVSKRKLIEFYLPVMVLIVLVLAGFKFLLSQGRAPTDYIGIPMMVFAFYSWFFARFYWSGKGLAYLAWVEFMFGPKTRNRALAQFLSGEHYDLMQTAKEEGEYATSLYCKERSSERGG